jgi:CHRD domain
VECNNPDSNWRKKMNRSYRFSFLATSALLSVFCIVGVASADILTYTAILSGANEVPGNASEGQGIATIVVDTDNLDLAALPFQVEFSGLMGAQSGAHIHQAPAGVNGGVVVPIPLGSPLDITVAMSPAVYAEFTNGNTYLNIHSAAFPGGEIRGQFELMSTVASGTESWGSIKSIFR